MLALLPYPNASIVALLSKASKRLPDGVVEWTRASLSQELEERRVLFYDCVDHREQLITQLGVFALHGSSAVRRISMTMRSPNAARKRSCSIMSSGKLRFTSFMLTFYLIRRKK